MKLMALVLFAGVHLAPALSAQQPKVAAKGAPSAEAAVIAREQQGLAALVRGDAATFNQWFGVPFTVVGPGGPVIWTSETAAALLKACTLTSLSPSDFRAQRVSKDIIVLTYRQDSDEVCNGQRGPAMASALSVWRREGARWSVIAHSYTPPSPTATPTLEGNFEYVGALRGQSIVKNGRFVFLYGPSDGQTPMTGDAGTYQVAHDTVTAQYTYSTIPGRAGQTFRWTVPDWSGDTATYVVFDASGKETGRGRAVRRP